MNLLSQLEEVGIVNAVSDGRIESAMDENNLVKEREINNRERIVVGLNEFISKDEPQPRRFSFSRERVKRHVEKFVQMKKDRNNAELESRLRHLYQAAAGNTNFHQAMIDAFVADGTIGEVWGTVRLANGLSYDPFNVINHPFSFE